MPGWWLNSSGLFFVLGSITFFAMTFMLVVMTHLVLQLRKQIESLSQKVEGIADKVDRTAKTVEKTTEEVSIRVAGITGVVDQSANQAFGLIERVVPYLLGVGLFWRLKALISRRSS
jgi:hypothetical protein